MQGWESVCFGVVGLPLLENKEGFLVSWFLVLFFVGFLVSLFLGFMLFGFLVSKFLGFKVSW